MFYWLINDFIIQSCDVINLNRSHILIHSCTKHHFSTKFYLFVLEPLVTLALTEDYRIWRTRNEGIYAEDLLRLDFSIRLQLRFPSCSSAPERWNFKIFCDFHALNSNIYPDQQALPNIQDTLDSLSKYIFFSVLDHSKAYHQLHLNKEPWHLTAFVPSWGLYKWKRKPFVSMNAPAVSRSLCKITYKRQFSASYLDDLLAHSKSFEDHVTHQELILQWFRKTGIKLKPSMFLISTFLYSTEIFR